MTRNASAASTQEPDIPAPAVSPEEIARDEGPELVGTPRRRLLLSIFLVVTLAGVLSCVMPDSQLKNGLLTVTRPYLMVTGLDQHWGMFAPNPRPSAEFVVARTDNADGTFDLYPLANAAGFSEYWNYRWLKYGEQMWSQQDNVRDRTAFALWVVQQQRQQGRHPVKVTLIRQTTPLLPPGPGPDAGRRRDTPFFSATVSAS